MNILYITHCDPRTTDFGSAQRSHLMWKALKRLGTVYTIYNIGPSDPNKVFDEQEHIASVSLLSPNPIVKTLQILFARYLAPAEWPFRSKRFIESKIPWKGVKFDCVVTRYLRTAAQTSAWKIASLYVDVDDLPSESFATIRRGRHSRLMGWLLQKIVNTWQWYVLKKCRGAWIANGDQVPMIEKMCHCVALPNLALPPSARYAREGGQKFQLMTVGLMSYEPNYEGVDWFLQRIWPDVHGKFPDLQYVIAGGGLSESYRAAWTRLPNVHVLGFVKNLEHLYEESLGVVAPIQSGAGTCIKILEGALRGRKIFATDFALRGFAKEDIESLGIEGVDAIVDTIRRLKTALAQKKLGEEQNRIERAAQRINSYEHFAQAIQVLMRLK